MRRELFIHFAFLFSFFVFISILKKWFSLDYWPFWLGGILGTLLPDLDHAVYALYLRPQDHTSQRISYMFKKKEIGNAIKFLYETRYERAKLIFHSATFQIIFLILTFWIITSSGGLFGRGLVLAFALHLSVDQIIDITESGNLSNWFGNFPLWNPRDKTQAKAWWGIGLLVVLLFGFSL